MLETFRRAFQTKDIRRKLGYTFLMLIVIRLGSQLPTPGVDPTYIKEFFAQNSGEAFNLFNAFTGGSFEQMSILALSITPYITSSIIVQLLTIAIPKLEEMQKDGEDGRKKIVAITRYLTVALALMESLAMAIGYTVVMGWILKYAVGTFTGATLAPKTIEEFGGRFGTMAAAFGNNIWQILALILCMCILIFGVGAGIEKANKILMPIFFALFVILGIYVAFQPGAATGYQYIFRVDKAAILDPKTWIFALGQAFFSLSVAGNGTLIYGSYLSDEEDIPSSAARVAFFDTVAAMLAALVIIPAMATTGATLDQGGPGLLFIYLPNLISSMPGSTIIAIIFFVAVLFAGMTSLINLYEAPIATVQEKLHVGRKTACVIIAVIGVIVSLLIQGIVSDWMDILSIYICPLGAGLAGIMFFWIADKEFALKAVNTGREKKIGTWFLPLGKYVLVPLALVALIAGAVLGGIG